MKQTVVLFLCVIGSILLYYVFFYGLLFALKIKEPIYYTLVNSFASFVILPYALVGIKKAEIDIKEEFVWTINTNYFYLLIAIAFCIVMVTIPFFNPTEFFRSLNSNQLKIIVFSPELLSFSTFIVFLNVVIWGPFFEELFIRSLIQRQLMKRYSLVISILISALIFAVGHLNYKDFLGYFIWGILIGIYYYKSRSTLYCIFLHSFINLTIFLTDTKYIFISDSMCISLYCFVFILLIVVLAVLYKFVRIIY